MMNDSHLLKDAIYQFDHLEKNIASHSNVLDNSIYPQPSTYLTTHYVCMKVAGFGWEWLAPQSSDDCFSMIKESIDSNNPVKSTLYENILFAGYTDSREIKERKLYVLSDGAEY